MDPVNTPDVLLQRLMSATTLRSRVISANIANQNTPGYIRRDVKFEELLEQTLDKDAKNFPAEAFETEPLVVDDLLSPGRPDGNNVNLEVELNALRENRLLFETYASIVEGRGGIKKAALGHG